MYKHTIKSVFSILLPLFALAALSASCEEEKRKGCTDPVAENYSPLADEDDGSCEYTDSTVVIWNEGEEGVWGPDPLTGHIEMNSCLGYTYTDTTDTFPGTGLIVVKDSAGDFGLAAKIINIQDGRALGNGYLLFDALIPPDSDLEKFDVFINGKTCSDLKMCENICRSGGVAISALEIDSTSFTEITVPLLDFESRYLHKMQTTFGIRGNLQSGSDTLMVINNIRWKTLLEEE